MFDTIKEQVNIVDAHEFYLGNTHPLRHSTASTTWTTDSDECPWCGHKGCYKVKVDENYVNCFSGACHYEGAADVIEFVRRTLQLETARDAAIQIIKDFNLDISYGWDVKQRMYNSAAEYYQRRFLTDEPQNSLGDMTPMEYQTKVRGHKPSSLDALGIGWADGGLYEHLIREGFSQEDIAASGLMNAKNPKRDYFNNCFVYPHISRSGRVCNFTIKFGKPYIDAFKASKGKAPATYQIKKEIRPADVLFMNERSLVDGTVRIAVVEGENDLASLLDCGWEDAILCINGQLSDAQAEYLKEIGNLVEIHTFFDHDDAGKKYIDKMWKVGSLGAIPFLFQYLVPENMNDVDNFLQCRKEEGLRELQMLHSLTRPSDEEVGSLVIKEFDQGKVFEARGAYWTIKHVGDNEVHTQLTNFVIKLRNVYIRDSQRIREVVFRHQSGFESRPFLISSEEKVSIKAFKELAANSVDGYFKGNEQDMIHLWEHVYESNKANIVHIPMGIGDLRREVGGWVFKNVMITSTGQVLTPDANGVFWRGASQGVKPANISAGLMDSIVDINSGSLPQLCTDISMEGIDKMERDVICALGACVGDLNIAITLIAWAKANVYSVEIFREYGFFPLLLVWGRHGQGKTTLARWILNIFGMGMGDQDGLTSVSQLRSNVGFERKSTFYHSLPMFVDEIRADKMCIDKYTFWRSFFNRSPRVMGTKEGFHVKHIPVNATFGFFGQDTFTDSALRSRCVSIKMPVNEKDTASYEWLNKNYMVMSGLMYKWILESTVAEKSEMFARMRHLERHIVGLKVQVRMAKIWSLVAYFAEQIKDKHFPDMDFNEYLVNSIQEDVEDQQESEMLNEFWESVCGLQSGENPIVTSEHITIDQQNNRLIIWLRQVYEAVVKNSGRGLNKESFSYNAIRQSIKDEKYYLSDTRYKMGRKGVNQRVIALDINKLPEVMKPIVEFATMAY